MSEPDEFVSPDGLYRWDPSTAEWGPRGQTSWPHTAAPVTGPAASSPRRGLRFGRRTVVIAVGVLIAVIIAAVVSVTSGGDSSPPSATETDSPADTSISDRPSACFHELGSLLDLTVNQGIQALTAVVGSTSSFFGLADNAAVQYKIDLSQYGRSGAQDRTRATLTTLCANASNPILTQAQLTDLATALGDSPDTDTLNRITVFDS